MKIETATLNNMGLDASSEFANNKETDQPAHSRNLISTFVIHMLESIISELGTSKYSMFYLDSLAEQVCLGMAWSETQKTGFLAIAHIL